MNNHAYQVTTIALLACCIITIVAQENKLHTIIPLRHQPIKSGAQYSMRPHTTLDASMFAANPSGTLLIMPPEHDKPDSFTVLNLKTLHRIPCRPAWDEIKHDLIQTRPERQKTIEQSSCGFSRAAWAPNGKLAAIIFNGPPSYATIFRINDTDPTKWILYKGIATLDRLCTSLVFSPDSAQLALGLDSIKKAGADLNDLLVAFLYNIKEKTANYIITRPWTGDLVDAIKQKKRDFIGDPDATVENYSLYNQTTDLDYTINETGIKILTLAFEMHAADDIESKAAQISAKKIMIMSSPTENLPQINRILGDYPNMLRIQETAEDALHSTMLSDTLKAILRCKDTHQHSITIESASDNSILQEYILPEAVKYEPCIIQVPDNSSLIVVRKNDETDAQELVIVKMN